MRQRLGAQKPLSEGILSGTAYPLSWPHRRGRVLLVVDGGGRSRTYGDGEVQARIGALEDVRLDGIADRAGGAGALGLGSASSFLRKQTCLLCRVLCGSVVRLFHRDRNVRQRLHADLAGLRWL